MKSPYHNSIERYVDELGVSVKPAHVEAIMRLEYRTLDHLSSDVFLAFVSDVDESLANGETTDAELDSIAESFGYAV